jgi:hypothetical protein
MPMSRAARTHLTRLRRLCSCLADHHVSRYLARQSDHQQLPQALHEHVFLHIDGAIM